MKNTQKNDCENVVELLVKDYSAKSRSDFDRKISSISADFINQGLFNSTVMVTKQMGAEFEYLDGLVNYVIESLKKDFGHISLGNCKDKLVAILETEYKKLIPFANSLLVKAGLAQQSTLECFQKRILDELEKAKEKVEIQCAIAEKQKATPKSIGADEKAAHIKLKAARITLTASIISLIGIILASPYWGPWAWKMVFGRDAAHLQFEPNKYDQKPVSDPNTQGTASEENQINENTLEPGKAMVEIFKSDTIDSITSMESISELPIFCAYWDRDLTYNGFFLFPDLVSEIVLCLGSTLTTERTIETQIRNKRVIEIDRVSWYIARFSFYYEAKETGLYEFRISHDILNAYKLRVKGEDIVTSGIGIDTLKVRDGICELKKGFHPVEFWLVSFISSAYITRKEDVGDKQASFEVKVFTPNGLDYSVITKDMMFLKKD